MEESSLVDFQESNLESLEINFERSVDLRYEGQEHTVKMKISNDIWGDKLIEEMKENFNHLHEFTYSFKLEDTGIEIVNLHLTAVGNIEKPTIMEKVDSNMKIENTIKETRQVYFQEIGWTDTKIYNRELLTTSHKIIGPAIIEEKTTSTLVLENQAANIDRYGNIIIMLGETAYE